MIQIAESPEEQQSLLLACRKSAFGCKIASIAAAYGFDKKFSCFWAEENAAAVYCLVDNVMIVAGMPKNAEETRSFLHMVGAKEILCALRNAELLGLPAENEGDVMQKQAESGEEAPERESPEVNIREVYFLLEACEMETDFEAFYLDLSHRLRHGAAMVFTEYREETLAGCVVVSSVTESSAVISAVAVDEAFRRQGIGVELMRRAEQALAGKRLYLFKEKGRHEEFYQLLGYHKTDAWVVAELS